MSSKKFLDGEDWLQSQLVRWMNLIGLFHFSVPNGGYRHPITAKRMKATGQVAGIPDLVIPIPFDEYHCTFLEVKRKGQYPTPTQRDIHKKLKSLGNYVAIIHSIDELIAFISYAYPEYASKAKNKPNKHGDIST